MGEEKPVVSRSFSVAVRMELGALWESCVVTDALRFESACARIRLNRALYVEIARRVGGGVPWMVIGAIHQRESNGDLKAHLHNGDPLTARTVHVPKGRPKNGQPPFTFLESAVDALTMPGKEWEKVGRWTAARTLWECELYNGLGYRLYRGIPSPYLWAGTNHYSAGKYVADGRWSATARDRQPGVAGILKVMKYQPEKEAA